MVETTAGRVWAQTRNGLAWYDDHAWREAPLPDGLSPRHVKALVATGDGGVAVVAERRILRGDGRGLAEVDLRYRGRAVDAPSIATRELPAPPPAELDTAARLDSTLQQLREAQTPAPTTAAPLLGVIVLGTFAGL